MPSTNAGTGPLTNNPMIEWDGSYEACTPDNGVTGVKVGLLVYRTGPHMPNGVTLCGEFCGYTLEDVDEIGIVVGPPSSPIYPKTYDYNTTAFTHDSTTCWVHWLKLGDIFWAVSGSISATYKITPLCCAASGLVELVAAGTTADKYNVHQFRCELTTSSQTGQLIKYLGRAALDTS